MQHLPPSAEDIEALAEQALAAIPERLRRHLAGVSIAVEELAQESELEGLDVESAWELTGLYRGVPLHLRSATDVARLPDMIVLYRLPILLEWIEDEVDLGRLVTNVVIHEAAHHFGFSDDEIAALEGEAG